MESVLPAPSPPIPLPVAFPAIPTTRPARFYEPELDVLRFCAFLFVFCFHALPSEYTHMIPRLGPALSGLLFAVRNAMSFGVCIFFLLSAYLITKLLILEREATGSIHMRSFYTRRVLRIWPLYLGFLLLMWLLGKPYLHVFAPVETGRLLAFLFFSGNLYSGLYGFTESPILPLWTVSIEEQFYILWPALARTGTLFLRIAAWVVIGIAVAATFALRTWASDPGLAIWTSSLVHFQFFALGSLIAIHFSKRLPTYHPITRSALSAAGVSLLLIAAGPLHINGPAFGSALGPLASAPLLTLGYAIMALGVVLIFLAFLGAARGSRRIPPALTYLGKISYGLYVFHDLSLQICKRLANHYNIHHGFRTMGAAALTLALAMLSYRFFEKPFLRIKDRFTLVPTRPA